MLCVTVCTYHTKIKISFYTLHSLIRLFIKNESIQVSINKHKLQLDDEEEEENERKKITNQHNAVFYVALV